MSYPSLPRPCFRRCLGRFGCLPPRLLTRRVLKRAIALQLRLPGLLAGLVPFGDRGAAICHSPLGIPQGSVPFGDRRVAVGLGLLSLLAGLPGCRVGFVGPFRRGPLGLPCPLRIVASRIPFRIRGSGGLPGLCSIRDGAIPHSAGPGHLISRGPLDRVDLAACRRNRSRRFGLGAADRRCNPCRGQLGRQPVSQPVDKHRQPVGQILSCSNIAADPAGRPARCPCPLGLILAIAVRWTAVHALAPGTRSLLHRTGAPLAWQGLRNFAARLFSYIGLSHEPTLT